MGRFFAKLEKPHFRTTLGPFWPNNPRTRFFSRKSGYVTLEVRRDPNFVQNIRKLLRVVPEENSRQTEKRTEGISRDLHFVGSIRHSSNQYSLFSET